MNVLQDLHAHQAWADAEHWKAIEACPAALADAAIRGRLYHIHQVQQFFKWPIGARDGAPPLRKPEEFPDHGALKAWGRSYHDEIVALVGGLSESRLRDRVDNVWFKDP